MRKFCLIFALVALVPLYASAAGPSGAVQNYPVRTSVAALNLTAQGPATVNSPSITSYGQSVYCTFNQTARTGSSSTTFAIQYLDTQTANAASPTWTTLLISAAVTTNAVTPLEIGPGLPATANASVNGSLPAVLRIQLVESGASSTITGDVTCDFAP